LVFPKKTSKVQISPPTSEILGKNKKEEKPAVTVMSSAKIKNSKQQLLNDPNKYHYNSQIWFI